MSYSKYSYTNTSCNVKSFGSGLSHEDILSGAGCRFFTFNDPRQDHNGKIYPDKYYIDMKDYKIKGIDFQDDRGNFICSYSGEDYDDILKQNREDIQRKKDKSYENVNIKRGTKREKKCVKEGERMVVKNDDTPLYQYFTIRSKDIELKNPEDCSEIYDKYNGTINPNNGKPMTCIAVYTNKSNDFEDEVLYIEFQDKLTNEKYHYISNDDKTVEEQIIEDMTKKEEKHMDESSVQEQKIDKAMNKGVNRR